MSNKFKFFVLGSVAFCVFGLLVSLFGCGSSSTTAETTSTTTTTAAGATTTTSTTATTAAGATTTTSTTVADATTTTISGLTAAPASVVKLCFIHHSVGGNWLMNNADYVEAGGDLGTALNANNYYVTETDYTWEAESGDFLGYTTDFGFWTTWFTDAKMPYVYANDANYYYTNTIASADASAENEIIVFKSCFPNSNLFGPATAGAATGTANPIEGINAGDDADQSTYYNVANAKWVYNQILQYCSNHTDKLFVVITSPPRTSTHYVGSNAANARAFNNWLVNDWLSSYSGNNVVVFDFYNVLTDLDNHHRYYGGAVQHVTAAGSLNTAHYPIATDGSDDHPNVAGNHRATTEFVPLLNYYYNTWKGLI
ncbi:hypothetical protein COT42_01200 [Candidatus Saganbacteria bacterium CG08_land_8_20_14_0_20_45_16]|uniref:SGNH hydrolase-type esterase domain-containing protein n=1 Tax=Candidatus Saganbacteria bacterium CG08_land_8_20_14_0_20_45_16 TaxID=2014293 RepID=A0A2H0Y1D2_UNCSA|nr:MAG: hypothetical protein COT42_01200 [Candidatus Saganbacteria bacterium CG08_land_8_20_14_0_20_45_16]